MELVLKAAAIAVSGTVLTMLLRQYVPELGLVLAILVSLLVSLTALGAMDGLSALSELIHDVSGLDSYLTAPVFKCVGIGIVSRFTADLCRDGGQQAAASAVELCAAVCALVLALPLMRTLLDMIGGLL